MNPHKLLSFFNEASRDELTALPGIGPTLTERLMTTRPFDSLEAVQTVKGINANLMKRLSVAVAEGDTQPAPEPRAVDKTPIESRFSDIKKAIGEKSQSISQGFSEFGESVRKQGKAARQTLEALPQKLEQTTRSRGQLWTIIISSVITVLVTILLTLAVLGGINGSLKFATGSQYRAMKLEASQLSAQVDILQQDLDGLRGRVDMLEGLGDRIVVLEKAQQLLVDDMEFVSQQVIVMNEKITLQEKRTLRFETFLKDMQILLDSLFDLQGGNE